MNSPDDTQGKTYWDGKKFPEWARSLQTFGFSKVSNQGVGVTVTNCKVGLQVRHLLHVSQVQNCL
jgi:hypothetical protein